MNPMDLKRGIDMAVEAVVADVKSRSKDIKTSEEIAQVGTISANGDRSIGEYLARAMEKVGNEGVITVEDAKGLETELEVVEGMQFDRGYLSPYFITNPEKMNVEFENPFILLYDQKISNLQPLIPVLEAIVQSGRALLIVPFVVRQTNFIGGGINAITKSGTNTYKGTAYIYHQNENMRGDAIDRETILGAREKDQSTTYGFTIGSIATTRYCASSTFHG